jgi:phosphoribosylamine-glycine ligase
MFALAKEIAMFKGRASAWTPILEQSLVDATNNMASTSEVNLAIVGDEESLLNGSWRVRAGV